MIIYGDMVQYRKIYRIQINFGLYGPNVEVSQCPDELASFLFFCRPSRGECFRRPLSIPGLAVSSRRGEVQTARVDPGQVKDIQRCVLREGSGDVVPQHLPVILEPVVGREVDKLPSCTLPQYPLFSFSPPPIS